MSTNEEVEREDYTEVWGKGNFLKNGTLKIHIWLLMT